MKMETLVVPGTLDSLALIRAYVKAAAEEAGLDSRRAYRLQLAVDELATNTINHGYYDEGIAGEVRVCAEIDRDSLTITLEDTAAPFDPRRMRRPEQIALPLAERPIGGLGVFLAMESVDEFRHEYVDNMNRNVLVMRRSTS
jgi:anti-sigma regulatory factor (Ser/Thr protein kinase)